MAYVAWVAVWPYNSLASGRAIECVMNKSCCSDCLMSIQGLQIVWCWFWNMMFSCDSDQDLVLGPFEVQGETRDYPGVQMSQLITSDSSASYSEPYWPNMSRTGEESFRQSGTSSCLVRF